MDSRILGDNRARTVSVFVGLTNQYDDILATSSPIHLIPNLNLLAATNIGLRQRYKWTAVAALGIFTFVSFLILT